MNPVNLKTAFFAAAAAAALLIIGVPSSSDRATTPMQMGATPR